MTPAPLLRLQGLGKAYRDTPVFDAVSLEMAPGEVVALVGDSGVGKSTLLNCIAGLDRADRGQVEIAGREVQSLDDHAAALLRREALGFVFQAFHVLPHLSVADNIALPLLLLGWRERTAIDARVAELLAEVDLAGLGPRRPRELSGGQLQRVAIARALVHRPALILADEPTGNLDPRTAQRVLDLLVGQARRHRAGCLIVTHSESAAAQADRRLRLRADGIEALR
ncbi:putative ABC transport system ATP-binding protein [Sphaerotilus sulfidivorans]|uniref:ABC transport system ATP-binding protein n=1 Tax=Sphaerotilus sulfidivorans TaxID=639200 RepID=A0A5C1Q0F6_9BURK|nr:ABC transporter ATP-binding protein [Sphaerotilus sulfidivorans]NZD44343.1 ABC transporter ATP-binding protein [Sphaerotilus sulfidivorans]QEN00134.1 ABC transporter ATP-binding protein [Sphaerotilus sulfidivorans]